MKLSSTGLVVLGVLCIAAVTTSCDIGHGSTSLTRESREQKQTLIYEGVIRFRDLGLNDYQVAVNSYGTPNVVEKFKTLDRRIWASTDPRLGWSYFFNVSIMAPVEQVDGSILLAFYNPWADVFLITQWKEDGGKPWLVDTEAVSGNLVRFEQVAADRLAPGWVRMDVFKPAAVGMNMTASIKSFEKLFSHTQSLGWRSLLPALDDVDALNEKIYPETAFLLTQSLVAINLFRVNQKGEDPRLPEVRSQTLRLVQSANEGKLSKILEATPKTLPETRQLLCGMPAVGFQNFEVASLIMDNKSCVVFLTATDNPAYYVSLVFQGKGKNQILQRVDLVPYALIYELADRMPAPKEVSLR